MLDDFGKVVRLVILGGTPSYCIARAIASRVESVSKSRACGRATASERGVSAAENQTNMPI